LPLITVALQEDRKVVTFIDERRKMRIPQRIKLKEVEEPKKKKASFKGVADQEFLSQCS